MRLSIPAVSVVLTLAHLVAIVVFSKGYLLTRLVLPQFSACSEPELGIRAAQQSGSGCWSEAAFDRTVVIIVDALRYDFVFGGKAGPAGVGMPKLLGMLQEAGPAAAAFKFIADTPSVTMSRIKAMATGNLPTFLDVSESFSASMLTEDNLLDQMQRQGKKVVVLGDSTWTQLFPPQTFAACHTFPSFNVKDLHSVDDSVWQNLVRYLAGPHATGLGPGARRAAANATCSPSADSASGRGATPQHGEHGEQGEQGEQGASVGPGAWDVLVAHYLGVDHCGHTHGALGPQMRAKLQQMDQQAEAVAEELLAGAGPGGPFSRTLLLVMGDHGQTLSGDHGGGSPEEVETALLAFHMGAWQAGRERTAAASSQQQGGEPAHTHGGAGEEQLSGRAPQAERVCVASGGEWGANGSSSCSASGHDARQEARAECSSVSSGQSVDPACLPGVAVPAGAGAGAAPSAAAAHGVPVGSAGGAEGTGAEAAEAHSGAQLERLLQNGLTPTWALLMGLPVPFGNLGRVNRRLLDLGALPAEAAGGAGSGGDSGDVGAGGGAARAGGGSGGGGGALGGSSGRFMEALHVNALQVNRYLTTYSAAGNLPARDLEVCGRLLHGSVSAREAARALLQGHSSAAAGGGAGGTGSAGEGGSQAEDAVQSAIEAYERYLEAAGDLARRKFTRFGLPAIACGCALVLGALALHVWLLLRACPWHRLRSPRTALAATVLLTHALGIFSVSWVQREGVVTCASVALVTVLLWGSAAVAAARRRAPTGPAASAPAPAARAASAAVPVVASSGAEGIRASAQASTAAAADRKPASERRQPSQPAQPAQQRWGRVAVGAWLQLRLAALAAVALGCNAALYHYSLVDPWGRDLEATKAPGGSAAAARAGQGGLAAAWLAGLGGWGPWVAVQLPLALLPVVIGTVGVPRGARHAGGMGLLGVLPYALASAWWALQLVGGSSHGGKEGAVEAASGAAAGVLGPGAAAATVAAADLPRAVAAAMRWVLQRAPAHVASAVATWTWAGAASPAWAKATSAGGSLLALVQAASLHPVAAGLAAWARGVLHMPLRLLLPRAVYALAGWALLRLALQRLRLRVPCRLDSYSRFPTSSAGGAATQHRRVPGTPHGAPDMRARASAAAVAAQQLAPLHALQGHTRCLVSCATALVTLVLGRRGPAVMLALWVQGSVMVGLALAGSGGSSGECSDAGGDAAGWRSGQDRSEGATEPALAAPGEESAMLPRASWGERSGPLQGAGCQLPPAGRAAGEEAQGQGRGHGRMAGEGDVASLAVLLALLGAHAFFTTGHYCEFSGLQYDSPFVGFDDMTFPTTPLLFWANTFGGTMLCALVLPLVLVAASTRWRPVGHLQDGAVPPAHVALVCYSLARTASLCVTVISAAIQLRFVMLWAPKLLFEVFFTAGADAALLLASLCM